MPEHWNQQVAINYFREHWTKNPDGLLEICLDRFGEIHGENFVRHAKLPDYSTKQLIDWFLSHSTWDQENQQWRLYNPYQRIERSDIYYDVCGWIK